MAITQAMCTAFKKDILDFGCGLGKFLNYSKNAKSLKKIIAENGYAIFTKKLKFKPYFTIFQKVPNTTAKSPPN